MDYLTLHPPRLYASPFFRSLLGDVSPQVESALGEIRNLRIEGSVLLTRLEALRERYRLNPADDTDRSQAAEPQVIRIVCSDGVV